MTSICFVIESVYFAIISTCFKMEYTYFTAMSTYFAMASTCFAIDQTPYFCSNRRHFYCLNSNRRHFYSKSGGFAAILRSKPGQTDSRWTIQKNFIRLSQNFFYCYSTLPNNPQASRRKDWLGRVQSAQAGHPPKPGFLQSRANLE